MRKAELVLAVAEQVNLSKKDVDNVITAVFDSIQKALEEGDKVQLIGFGTFEVKTRKARKGRNPRNPEEVVDIPESKAPVFKPGKNLKECINK